MDLRQGQRYQATVILSGFQQIASNAMVEDEFKKIGFTEVLVTGRGKERTATGRWPKDDFKNAPIPAQVTEIKEL